MRFLEREPQVAAILGYAAEASAGLGRLVLVEGEAGVGKSTLLERLEPRMSMARWAWGVCDGLTTPRPLAPLRDIAADLGGDLDAATRADAPREQLFTMLLDELRNGDRLTVLVFEDVHWADDATLDLLRHLGRRVQKLRGLLLVTFRDDEAASPQLRLALGDLARQRTARRVTLPPLTVGAIAMLAEGTDLDPVEVHALTGGNPFFVAEVLAGGGDGLPASARDSVLARAAMLSAPARELLEVAALVGNRVDPDLLHALVDVPDECYDELVATGLLKDEGRSVRFRHEIGRLAVAEAVPPYRRVELHRQVLAELRRRGTDNEARLAFHAEGAGDREAALRHATAAGRAASALGSHREAVQHLRTALRHAPSEDVAARAGLHELLGQELGVLDEWPEAEAMLVAALDLWRNVGDELRVGDLLRQHSRALWRLSRGAEAQVVAAQARRTLEQLPRSRELARCIADHATSALVNSDCETAAASARQAVELAEQLALPDVLSDALDTLACTLQVRGTPWEATMERALHTALDAGCEDAAGRAYTNYYSNLVDALEVARGEPVYEAGITYCEEHDLRTWGNCLQAARVQALEATCRWDEAATLARGQLAHQALSPINWMHYSLFRARIAVRRGDLDADALWDVMATVDSAAEPQYVVPGHLTVLEWHWLAGRHDEAVAELAIAERAARSDRLSAMVAVWGRRLGHPAASYPGRLLEPWSAELTQGPRAGAAEWERRGNPYEAGLALLTSPDPDDWLSALTCFDSLGAQPAATRVRRRLRDAGVRSVPAGVRSATRAHPAGLTTREQEVLEQLCAGRTNVEIAEELVISVKTAGHHVSAVLAKLGVPTRRDAAVEARRLGLVRAQVGGSAGPT